MSVNQVSTGEYESQIATEAVKRLYLDEKKADVHFIFKSGERVPAHKNLLAAASDVFDAMFYGSIKENGDVKIDDASAVGFVEFLQFFYFNTIKMTMANIGDVMNLGHKYNVTECFNLCVRFLVQHVTTDNVCQVYSLAVLFEQTDLKTKCEDLISSHTGEVLQSASFLESNRSVLNLILKLDWISCPETVVFNAVMSWVKATSNQVELTKDIIKTHLGNLFYEIRFRSMTYDEFVGLLSSFGNLFVGDEFNEILQMIRNEEFQPKMFNALRRKLPNWNEGAIVMCDRNIRFMINEPYRIKNTEITTFTTNRSLLLGNLVCAPIFKYKRGDFCLMLKPLPADVTIIKVPNWNAPQSEAPLFTVLHTMKVELTAERENTIKLSKPIFIDPKFKYEIRMNMDISEDCVTFRELESEVQLQRDIVVTFHNDPVVNGKTRGVICELAFNRVN